MNVGELIEDWTGEQVKIKGAIRTYSLDLDFVLSVNEGKRGDKSPTHIIFAKGRHGKHFQAGSAWASVGKESGERYYNLSFNIPELFEKEMRYTAFDRKQGGRFDIVIDKEKPEQQAAA